MMTNFNQNFEQFLAALVSKEYGNSSAYLDNCFTENPKSTLNNLYTKKVLFSTDFQFLNFSAPNIPPEYRLLFELTKAQVKKTNEFSLFVKELSKEQLLQGLADCLEKNNAWLKHNSSWSQHYANGNENYLETERQATYFSVAGIQFQEIITQFYTQAFDNTTVGQKNNGIDENKFKNLIKEFGLLMELKDIVERHLFFNWSLNAGNAKTLKTMPPAGQKEGSYTTDIVNLLKLKSAFNGLNKIAEQKLMQGYLKKIKEQKLHPKEYLKFFPSENNKEEMKLYAEAFLLNVKADQKVELELELYRQSYFPGNEDINEIVLTNGTKLPLRETFRILSFISELSKPYIQKADEQYKTAVTNHPLTPMDAIFEMKLNVNKGDKEALDKIIKEYCTEEYYERQEKVKEAARKSIANENCLIKYPYDTLVKVIQWLNQYDEEFIKKVIDIFVFDASHKLDVTRAPFFRIQENLCWMPNLVAYVSFAENLIENLLAKDLISIHRVQTELYEAGLKNIFRASGYNVIENDENKTMKDKDGNRIGDFDLLAFKGGHLINLQLKLTTTRNDYKSRHSWKERAGKKAADQLNTALTFIENNPADVKKILGITENVNINKVSSYIISNSFMYDHEIIYGFLKVSYFEITRLLMLVELAFKNDSKNTDKLMEFLEGNKLFEDLEKMPRKSEEMRFEIAGYFIVRPGSLAKNEYVDLI